MDIGDIVTTTRYEQSVTEFMSHVDGFKENYETYANAREESGGSQEKKRFSILAAKQAHPILRQVYETRKAINEGYRSDRLNWHC